LSDDIKLKKVVRDSVREVEAQGHFNGLLSHHKTENQAKLAGLLDLGEIIYWGMEVQKARGCFTGFKEEEMQGIWSTYLIQASKVYPFQDQKKQGFQRPN